MSLTFEVGAGSLVQCRTVTIIDDTVVEDSEQVSVILVTVDPDITIQPSSAPITIIDDDGNNSIKKCGAALFTLTSTQCSGYCGLCSTYLCGW